MTEEAVVLLCVTSVDNIGGVARVPSSKPETQRAIIVGSLARGRSLIHNDLRCVETQSMRQACENIGAQIEERPGYLEVAGTAGNIKRADKVFDCKGSGLVFRVFTALSSIGQDPFILTGDATLRKRVMHPLFAALRALGANLNSINDDEKAPVVNWGGGLKGGECRLPGDISSQFVTAILLAAPFAHSPVKVNAEGEILSKSYIRQTIAAMAAAGVSVDAAQDLSAITVAPGRYEAVVSHITGDYTSASYLLAAAALFKTVVTLTKINSDSLQGEREIVGFLQELGVAISIDNARSEMTVDSSNGLRPGEYEFDVSNCPNITPTMAAIGAYVDGIFRVVGGSITRLHKAPRITAIASELAKLGVDIKILEKDSVVDGFEIRGRDSYRGGVSLESWGDHRIFMSLFVASLRAQSPVYLAGYEDVDCSFPTFFEAFRDLGVEACEVGDAEARAAIPRAATTY